VSEYFGMTEVSASQVWICGTAALPTPATLTFPLPSDSFLERFEGMYVSVPGPVYVSEYYNFGRYGEVVVTPERQFQPTAVDDPTDPDAEALRLSNLLQRITVDDGRSYQNPDPAIHPDGTVFDMDHLFRGGGTLTDLTGVLDYRFSLYRIQPPDWESLTARAVYTDANPRGDVPEVGGRLTAASFNVLNYFSTIDTGTWICGPSGDMECRGADTTEEFTRQRDKIFAALADIDADVVGLMEIENAQAALDDLVDGLNGVVGAGTYASIDVLPTGTDAISVAVIYKPGSVTPVGAASVLDDTGFLDPLGEGEAKNRPAIAQTFMENATGELFTVVVNHLKSKGSACVDDSGDLLQGNCNLTRTAAAEYLMDWLAGDPTGSGDRDVLLLGDYNAYDHEDPIGAILEGADDAVGTTDDYADLLRKYQGEYAYTYVFDGQLGYLDYGLASSTLASQVTGAAAWHINADEPSLIDYDMSYKQDAQDALYAPDPYRSSDHDPVIVGLDLNPYEFGGFEPPIREENVAKAGQAIPVKFSLGGFFGYDIFFQMPSWQDGTKVDAASIGGGLKYDWDDGMYVIVLETDKDWKGETLDLVLELADGTVHTATFDFR
jgi:predicted extracellular nuclease